MKEATINIDSLPVDRFDPGDFEVYGYTASKLRIFQERPSFSFLGEFITGKPPCETNMWFDFIKVNKSPYWFILGTKGHSKNRSVIVRRLLMIISRALSGRTYNPYNVPLGLLKEFDVHPNVEGFYKNMNSVLSISRKTSARTLAGEIEEVEQGLRNASENFVFANYSKLDPLGHKQGPDSKKYREYSEKIFDSIRQILRTKKYRKVTIMSDHGMYPIKKHLNVLDVLEGSLSGKGFIAFVNSPVLRIWGKPEIPEEIVENLKDLEKKKVGHILNKRDLKKWKLPTDRVFGEIIFWLRKGYHWIPDFYHGEERIRGMHNYWGSGKRFECTFALGD